MSSLEFTFQSSVEETAIGCLGNLNILLSWSQFAYNLGTLAATHGVFSPPFNLEILPRMGVVRIEHRDTRTPSRAYEFAAARNHRDGSTARGIPFEANGLEALEKIGVLENVMEMGSAERILEVRDWNREVLLEADYGLLDHPQNYLMTADAVQVEHLLGSKAENLGAQTVWNTRFHEILWNNGIAQGVRCDVE